MRSPSARASIKLVNSCFFSSSSLVLYGFYLSNDSFTLDLPGISYKTVTTYVLEPADSGRSLQSFTSKLNGNVISWSKNANVPDLTAQGNLTSLPVTLPGYSQFFVVIE